MFTPEGDIETNVVSFANKWKTKESCANNKLETVIKTAHPCDENIQYKHLAESYCSNITGKLFSDCHTQVDRSKFIGKIHVLLVLCYLPNTNTIRRKLNTIFIYIMRIVFVHCNHNKIIISIRATINKYRVALSSSISKSN